LYACLFPGLVFWIFCSSRQTSITVTSAISLLVGASLGPLAGGDPARFSALAECLALIVAVVAFLAWLLNAGALVNFISEPVMVGFKTGLALVLVSTQMPKLCGFKGSHGDFWERSGYFFSHIHETNWPSLIMGVSALVLLVLGKIFLKNKPVALFVVIAGVLAGTMFPLEKSGVKMLGDVPQGLPHFGLPAVTWGDINELLPVALACFLLGAVETAGIGRMFAAKYGYRFDAGQEFLALAAANFASGIGRAFPVSGGMSQSLVNESAGSRTPLSGFIAALIILLITLFLSSLLEELPQPVLAAIILVAVAGLFKLEALKHLWRSYRAEFVVAVAAILGVLGSGVLRGVMIGVILSILQLIHRASKPHVAFLGRIPGTRRFSDLARHEDNEPCPGVLICRPEAGLVYFNVDHLRDTVLAKIKATQERPKLLLLDLSASPHVDLQAAQTLVTLHQELTGEGIQFQIVEARAAVRDTLRVEGLEDKLGHINRFTSVGDAVDDFLKGQGSTAQASPSK
jgi:high affinity sulfate transporter 1